ncbi:hypothetical protein TSOC_004342 [Tetrabaena socialis]|uniref:Uncharacterized protein n=1 Tax=Tetrabaena socialis TaxID=47790 RepID=A0A2J8A996_9CHLO|nr:hypothetical protein TSOC_004342 [Tetrabaena socialis]|eukprot:PNH09080.1 hypothetical protein TSOC_004342 [Tetrabaena socialis]
MPAGRASAADFGAPRQLATTASPRPPLDPAPPGAAPTVVDPHPQSAAVPVSLAASSASGSESDADAVASLPLPLEPLEPGAEAAPEDSAGGNGMGLAGIGSIEGVSYLVVLAVIGWSIYTKVTTGSGLPVGPSGLLGAVEGVSYLSLLAGIVVFALKYLS